MNHFRPGMLRAPTPEQFAAYVDGQLEPALRDAVEAWLHEHPEAAAEMEGHSQLTWLWQATTPSDPEKANWAATVARIHGGYLRARSRRVRRRRLVRFGLAGGWAAALLLVLWSPYAPGPAENPPGEEPLPVVSQDEVEIVSLRAADRASLVVGVPPVAEPLVLAAPGDVAVDRVEPDADGMVPDIHRDEGAVTTMIVAPMSTTPIRAPEPFR